MALPLFWTPPCTSITDALIDGRAADRNGRRRARVNVDAAGELDAASSREAQRATGGRVQDDDGLTDRHGASGTSAGEKVRVAAIGAVMVWSPPAGLP